MVIDRWSLGLKGRKTMAFSLWLLNLRSQVLNCVSNCTLGLWNWKGFCKHLLFKSLFFHPRDMESLKKKKRKNSLQSLQVLPACFSPREPPSFGMGLLSVYNPQLLILFLEVVTPINSEVYYRSYMRKSHGNSFSHWSPGSVGGKFFFFFYCICSRLWDFF